MKLNFGETMTLMLVGLNVTGLADVNWFLVFLPYAIYFCLVTYGYKLKKEESA